MTTNYLGSGNTVYTFDDGKTIELSKEQLDELCMENKFYIAMRDDNTYLTREKNSLEEQLRDKEDKIDDLYHEIRELEQSEKKISKDLFHSIKWTGGMKVKYGIAISDVISVDFEDETIQLYTDEDIDCVHYSKCELVDSGVYALNGSLSRLDK